MRPSRGMGAINTSKMPGKKIIHRKDDPNRVELYKEGGQVMAKKWIQEAIKKPGALKSSLGVKKGEKIPAGKLNSNEDPLECAKRELEEETGFRAKEWKLLGTIHPVISHSTEFIDIYLAQGLQSGESALDEEEFLDVFAANLDELVSWIKEGKVTDVKTIIATYWLQDYLKTKSQA